MSEEKQKIKIIVFKESLFQSVLSDFLCFVIITAAFSFNHIYVGSGFLNGLLLIIFVVFALVSTTKRRSEFYNIEDVVKFLEK